eukprot:GHVL01032534.1.p1 GENE.GHVL01032534.1~~GHVL01032534.1.p1  ORF type:complete len:414 (+),score=48.61 GHVL01032534.1:23-1264(+)
MEGLEIENSQSILEGACLIKFESDGAPLPFLRLLPRLSYLPCILDTVLEFFSPWAPPTLGNDDVWLDLDGVVIDWRQPVGLIIDINCGVNVECPVVFKLHLSGAVRDYHNIPMYRKRNNFFSTIFLCNFKQGLAVHRGGLSCWSSLHKDDTELLVDSVCRGSVVDFLSLTERTQLTNPVLNDIKFVLLKLYVVHLGHIMRTVTLRNCEGRSYTIRDAISVILPDIYYDSTDNKNIPLHKRTPWATIVCQGVEIPSDASLDWLMRHCTYLDLTLHVAIRMSPDQLTRHRRVPVKEDDIYALRTPPLIMSDTFTHMKPLKKSIPTHNEHNEEQHNSESDINNNSSEASPRLERHISDDKQSSDSCKSITADDICHDSKKNDNKLVTLTGEIEVVPVELEEKELFSKLQENYLKTN